MYYGRSIGHDMSPKFIYSNPCRSRKFFTPPQPSPYQGEGVRNSQMMRGLLYTSP